MNLQGFLKQSIVHEPKTGENDWSEPIFGAPVTLSARVEEKQTMVRSPGGLAVQATTQVMLVQEVAIGDRLGGYEVQARESIVDVSGRVLGWRVYL